MGATIRFEIALLDDTVVFAGEGVVTWAKPKGMGVKFTTLDPATEPMLERLLSRRAAAAAAPESPAAAQAAGPRGQRRRRAEPATAWESLAAELARPTPPALQASPTAAARPRRTVLRCRSNRARGGLWFASRSFVRPCSPASPSSGCRSAGRASARARRPSPRGRRPSRSLRAPLPHPPLETATLPPPAVPSSPAPEPPTEAPPAVPPPTSAPTRPPRPRPARAQAGFASRRCSLAPPTRTSPVPTRPPGSPRGPARP